VRRCRARPRRARHPDRTQVSGRRASGARLTPRGPPRPPSQAAAPCRGPFAGSAASCRAIANNRRKTVWASPVSRCVATAPVELSSNFEDSMKP
jgi:hypothetical protein